MPPKNTILTQISKWASNASRNLNGPNMPEDIAELRQKIFSDYSLLKLIASKATRNHKSKKGLSLLAGELAVAVNSVAESGETELLKSVEQDVRETIRKLFG